MGNSDFNVTAFMCVFNEADILPWTLKHLIDQGVDVHVIDNWSTDGSDRIAQRFPFAGFEQFPGRGRRRRLPMASASSAGRGIGKGIAGFVVHPSRRRRDPAKPAAG